MSERVSEERLKDLVKGGESVTELYLKFNDAASIKTHTDILAALRELLSLRTRLWVAVEALKAASTALDAVGAHVPRQSVDEALEQIGELPEG